MNEFEVLATTRPDKGTGSSRRLRREGRIPAILYGGGDDALAIAVDGNRIHRQLQNEAFIAHVLTIKIEDKESQAVLKAVQRNPATHRITHLDFQRISAQSEIHIHVPLHFLNEEQCAGKKAGGVVTHLLVEVEIGCLPKDLPEFIEIDLSNLNIGESVHLSELPLPDGVRLMTLAHNPDNDQPVVSVQHPQKVEEDRSAAETEEGQEG
ncbi:50S ribosomal protein L25/general stress protein Ctc [Thioalkalivibrio sp. HK1]|uniref:50S ribosomal protein L25/general stress protein Ctc n=1 Tax=Thioalkalivibrio sp. HK1 TaxID=1469245 RepID=UPI0004702958|nr:50S ribosomal protein L25/general stress protein Ctc [Thioalkalivibrio sp. HK1]